MSTLPHDLRSTDQLLMLVSKNRLNTRGDRGFSVAAPKLCNELALQIKTQRESCVTSTRLSFILILLNFYALALFFFFFFTFITFFLTTLSHM